MYYLIFFIYIIISFTHLLFFWSMIYIYIYTYIFNYQVLIVFLLYLLSSFIYWFTDWFMIFIYWINMFFIEWLFTIFSSLKPWILLLFWYWYYHICLCIYCSFTYLIIFWCCGLNPRALYTVIIQLLVYLYTITLYN